MNTKKRLFQTLTLLILFTMAADLYLLPKKASAVTITDFEVTSSGRRTQTYYAIPASGSKFSIQYNCYDYLKVGDTVEIYKSMLFRKTQAISFERDGEGLYFKAGMANIFTFIYLLGMVLIFFAAAMILSLLKKFDYQKQRLFDSSFVLALMILIFYFLVC